MGSALGKRMREIRTDRGTEFLNKELKGYLTEHGIIHNTTAPYSPEQNGVAERGNRTIIEGAGSMLYAVKADLGLWAEAVRTAIMLRNLIPGKNQSKTPSEPFWGRKPSVSYYRNWGFKAFVKVGNARQRMKLEPRALTCVFVAYEPKCKAWRFWNPTKDT